MKKSHSLIIIAIMFIIAVVLTIHNKLIKPVSQNLDNNSNIATTEEMIVLDSYENKKIEETNPYITFDVKYPSFKKADNTFNNDIENLLKDQIKENTKNAEENWQARYDTQVAGDNIPKVPTTDEKFSFYSDYTIVQSNSSYISFVLNYGGFIGGAHGYEVNVSYNYDVKNQKILSLKDMFPNNPDYLKYLSEESRKYLVAQYAMASEEDKKNSSPEAIKEYIDNMISMINQGTEPKEENFNVFTFTPDKIKIYFADYQVGPHAIGMPEIEVDRK